MSNGYELRSESNSTFDYLLPLLNRFLELEFHGRLPLGIAIGKPMGGC